jgi:hypothetical protein
MSRHNRRQELIDEHGYCECKWSSPSSHHDCCINPGCGKVIKTIYEMYSELKKETDRLKEYASKMADPDSDFYVSHSREYEVKESDGTIRIETVYYIKDIQQMAKDAKKALGK